MLLVLGSREKTGLCPRKLRLQEEGTWSRIQTCAGLVVTAVQREEAARPWASEAGPCPEAAGLEPVLSYVILASQSSRVAIPHLQTGEKST